MLAALRRILRLDAGRRIRQGPRRLFVRARYDAALTNENNRRHWANADGLSANAANSPEVRRILRNRARYEVANNSYARGIVLTLANDCIGTGPRLQMLSLDREGNSAVEREFARWTVAVGLADKLRIMRVAKAEDGEAFAVFTSNPRLDTPVKLDLKLVEAEQVCTPDFHAASKAQAVDGIVFDEYGNPLAYQVLRQHPGDNGARWGLAYDSVPAQAVLHYFRVDRPGQYRGIPELTPALPLFAMLRDYTLATLDAAKAAAYFAGILHTDAPPNGEADAVEAMDTIELERNMLMTMPGGWKMSQVRAEQPASTYAEFKREVLNEIARCLNMPFNVAAGNSSGYNYASGRLDHQTYFKAIRVEQAFLGAQLLDRLFAAWVREAVLVESLLPQPMRALSADWSHQWFWDGHEHVDPLKEANAQATRLSNHTTTLAEEYAKRGRDWEMELRQRAKEAALLRELGLPPGEALQTPAEVVPVSEDTDE
ncbi:MAG: phage portal protein [Planctomycetes bacterium]|nr:phage portal protein [Planctomycetota bacterium]